MYDRPAVVAHVSALARDEQIDHVAALDDFDVEIAAAIREHLRLPGMGDSQARLFRDKLAMRVEAREAGIRQPDFVHALNPARIAEFVERCPPPWVLKPRSEASAVGIKKIGDAGTLWHALEGLHVRQPYHLIEQYIAGAVYHVDALVEHGEIIFAETHRYATPLFDVMHSGGIFSTRTLERGSDDDRTLRDANRVVLKRFGMQRGVAHTEFIKGPDGQFYFLETASRVGGANIVEVVEGATGINLWREWARLELADRDGGYRLPAYRQDYAGSVICLARQEYPDTSAYRDAEIAWRMHKQYHAGLIVASHDSQRIDDLLGAYARRFAHDFLAVQPAPDKPTS
jgi:biotin carboxylase